MKFAANGGNVAQTVAGIAEDVATLRSPTSTPFQKLGAAVSLASEFAPVSVGDVKDAVKAADKAGEALKSLKSSTKIGDKVKTPDNSKDSFNSLKNGQGEVDKKTGIIFQKSNTNHSQSPGGEWKAGTKKGQPPTKGNKDTITGGKDGGCLIKKDRC